MSGSNEWNKGAPPHASASKPVEGSPPGELARMARRVSEAAPASNDDSGLIDIRALMAVAQGAERANRPSASEITPIPTVQNLDIYPFGPPVAPEPTAPQAPALDATPARSAPRRKAIPFIGAAALLVALAVGGAVLFRPQAPGGEGPRAGADNGAGALSGGQNTPTTNSPQRVGSSPSEDAAKGPVEATNKDPVVVAPPEDKRAKPATPGRSVPAGKLPKGVPPKDVSKGPKPPPPPKSTCRADDLLCHMKQSTGQK